MIKSWEQSISLYPSSDAVRPRIGPASRHRSLKVNPRFRALDYSAALETDTYDLPSTVAREGYYGDDHFDYWLSGLQDSIDLMRLAAEFGLYGKPIRYLDFGGASGRVARHMSLFHGVPECIVADINREHVNFVVNVFDGKVRAFQSSSIPHLPLEDNALDLISAYSVFSHIESFDEVWLLELRRVLRKGGVLALTANIDNFQRVDESWPAYPALARHPEFDLSLLGKPLKEERLVVRWSAESSYSSIVFYSEEYVRKRWVPWFSDIKLVHGLLPYQTMLLLRK